MARALQGPGQEVMMLQVRRILAPIDDTPLSDKALDHALTLAERFGSQLYVLYVRAETRPSTISEQARDEEEFDAEFQATRETALRRLRAGHTLPVDHVHAEVRTGDPLTCILEAADDHGVDLIVMGTHGRKGLSDRLIGTTTERVLLNARAGLFVVREDEPDIG
jgi:nucleotide-binding universal stress UspA family protein